MEGVEGSLVPPAWPAHGPGMYPRTLVPSWDTRPHVRGVMCHCACTLGRNGIAIPEYPREDRRGPNSNKTQGQFEFALEFSRLTPHLRGGPHFLTLVPTPISPRHCLGKCGPTSYEVSADVATAGFIVPSAVGITVKKYWSGDAAGGYLSDPSGVVREFWTSLLFLVLCRHPFTPLIFAFITTITTSMVLGICPGPYH